jgi:hypothetical protein
MEPVRNVRVAEDLWRPAMEKAHRSGTTLTDVIIAALRMWVSTDGRVPGRVFGTQGVTDPREWAGDAHDPYRR